MAVDSTGAGLGSPDLTSLLKTAIEGNTMGNLLGGNQDGGGFLLGALLGRLLFNQNGLDGSQNADRAAIDSAVAAALANANQQNNNSMTLLKDIQDTGQDIVGAINASENTLTNQITQGNQTLLVNQLQSQIANLQGQGDIKSAIAVGNANIINEVHETAQDTSNQINAVNTNMLKGFADLASKIDQNLITELREQLADSRNRSAIDSGNVTVTNTITQRQDQQQSQAAILREVDLLRRELQLNTQSTIAIGSTLTGAAQTATNVRQ